MPLATVPPDAYTLTVSVQRDGEETPIASREAGLQIMATP